LAAGRFHRLADVAQDLADRVGFGYGHAQWVIQLDAGELERSRFDIGTGKGFDPEKLSVLRIEKSLLIHPDGHCSDFQQGIGGAVEPTALRTDHDRQEAAKTARHGRAWFAREVALPFVVELRLAHALASRRHCSVWPA